MVKYRHKDQSLVLKITDNEEVRILNALESFCAMSVLLQCLKYRTDQLQDVKKLEKLNGILMRHMVSREK